MSCNSRNDQRLRFSIHMMLLGLAAIGVWLLNPAVSTAAQEPSVVRVEEDWKIVLTEPNVTLDSPQFYTVISPFGNLDSYYAQVHWNYRELPKFFAGGLQLQAYSGDKLLFRKSLGTGKLINVSESCTWTQVLVKTPKGLTFKIGNGNGSTWGPFGMRLDIRAYVPNLNGYSSALTAKYSGISFGSNRVKYLGITKVRRYSKSGLISTDGTPKVVFKQAAN